MVRQDGDACLTSWPAMPCRTISAIPSSASRGIPRQDHAATVRSVTRPRASPPHDASLQTRDHPADALPDTRPRMMFVDSLACGGEAPVPLRGYVLRPGDDRAAHATFIAASASC